MIKAFLNMFIAIFSFFKYPFYVLVTLLAIFLFSVCINFIIHLCKGERLAKNSGHKPKKKSILSRVFIDVPKQFVTDLFDRPADFFTYQGMIIYEGRQGMGKTISMVENTMRMQEEFPKALCTTNLAYEYEDKALKDWRMLMSYKNGFLGVVVDIDELQNWFSSNDSKNFPPEMLEVITQNRKNRRIIQGTAQNFYLLAKAIRSQATEVRRCTTLLGCLTIVRRFEPILDSEGVVVEWKRRGMYFFVHDKKLRECYDTYKVIERLRNVGFKEQPILDNSTNLSIAVNLNKKKK